jgi:2-amino-4-hydroxy-6-hydroxymethyldihydropteridine diphosphokinase
MNRAVILLGSNSGDKFKNINDAITSVNEIAGRIISCSKIYKTAPWGNQNQDEFLNQVIIIATEISPSGLMDVLLKIEKSFGRERGEKWSPRVIDLDILYYNNDIINQPDLKIPHPHLHERRFTMIPLVELLPEMIHPVILKKNNEILEQLNDSLMVKEYDQETLKK